MNEKISTYLFCILVFLLSHSFSSGEEFNLSKCEEFALQNNRELRSALKELEKAEIGYVLAWEVYSPKLFLNATYTLSEKLREITIPPDSPFSQLSQLFGGGQISSFAIDFTYDYNLSFQFVQPLFNTKILLGIQNSYLVRKLMKEKVRQIKNNLRYRVRELFYTALLLQELIKVSEESLKLAEEQLKVTKAKFQVGEATEFEVLRNEVEVSSARVNLVESRNNYEKALLALSLTMGIAEAPSLKISGDLELEKKDKMELTFEEAVNKALSLRPEIRQIEIAKEMKKREERYRYYEYIPSLSLIGQYNLYTNNLREKWLNDYSFLLSLNWDIFTGFTSFTNAKMEKKDLEKITEQEKLIKDSISAEIKEVFLEFKEAEEMMRSMEDAVKTAEASVKIARERFKTGLMTSLELMDAHMALKRARAGYLRAIYAYKKALEKLKLSTGEIGGEE